MAGDAAQRAIRWERARQRHEAALGAAGMVPWRAGRRLRYACLMPAGWVPWTLAAAGVTGYLGWTGFRGDFSAAAVVRAGLLGLAFGALCTHRASVTEAGLSFDVAGVRRPSIFGFVPLYAVREVVSGTRPEGWPGGSSYGAPWPGRHRVRIRYEDAYGEDRVCSAWVRDPGRYAETVLGDRPERHARGRSRRRR